MNRGFFMANRGRYFVQQGSGGGAGPFRRTFLRFDGVSQYAYADPGPASLIFPGGAPNAPAGDTTFVYWVRKDPASLSGTLHTASAAATGQACGWGPYTQPNVTVRKVANFVRKYVGSTSSSYREYIYPSGEHPWESVAGEWRFTAMRVRSVGHNLWAAEALRPNTTDTSLSASYVWPTGRRFVLAGFISGTGANVIAFFPGDIRAPALYGSYLSDVELAALEAAGPSADQSSAHGWWPGDDDEYPLLRNLGTEGAAWDLTLVNGSQAMIMEE